MRSRSVAWGDILPLATLLLVALGAAGPLWGPGLLNTRGGGDSPFLLLRTHQLAANLRAGSFPVRWMPDAAYGLGYPFFNYYAALPYYLAAGFTLVGLDILSAIKLTQTLFLAAAALSMYGWAQRTLRSREAGWLTACAYTLAPFHLVNVYVRGDSLSEFAAFAFFPLILWGLDRLAARPSIGRVPPPALAYAGLILTHNASALIFSLFILLYVVLYASRFAFHTSHSRPGELLSRCSLLILPLMIGLLLSAWFWVPALAEIDQVQLTAQTTGYFFYGNHFRMGDLVQRRFIFDYTFSPDSPSPFAMGLVQAALALSGFVAVVVGWGRSAASSMRHTYFAVIGLLLSTLLITPLSRPLWDRLPLLLMVQFPWRFLSVQALFTALLTGAVVLPLRFRGGRRWWGVGILAVLLAVAGLGGLRPEYLPITAEGVTAERLQLYELFTGNVGSTIRHEYLPRWVRPRPHTGPTLLDPDAPPRAISLDGELASAKRVERKPTRRVWTVDAGADGAEMAFPIYYWPGWRAAVDGSAVEVTPAPGSGYLTLSVPSGTHTVGIWLGRTLLRTTAELTSLAAALVVVGLWVLGRRRNTEGRRQGLIRSLPLITCFMGLVIIFALLIAFSPRVKESGVSDLTMDFDAMPYLHHNPGGVDLGDWRMMGYRYSADRLAPGETLHVTLDWQAWQGDEVLLQLVPPAAVRHSELAPIAQARISAQPGAEGGALDLAIPDDAGPGLHLVSVGQGARTVYLRPIWVGEGRLAEGVPERAAFADGALRLHAAEATQAMPDRLDVQFSWSAASPVAANYKLSLRLADPAGNEWAPRVDEQPGYGFLPTSLWSIGRIVNDRYVLPLAKGTPPGDNYTLTVILYGAPAGDRVGRYTLPVSLECAAMRPDAPVVARFGDELALSRLEVPDRVRQQGQTLYVTAYWLTLAQPSKDYIAEWQLKSEESVAAARPLAPGSPSSCWPVGAWVAGRAELSIPPTASPGDYTLSLALRDPDDGVVLGTYVYPEPVRVRERKRVWEPPPMEREVSGRFGDMIELVGYDLEQEGGALHLTLHWRALGAIDQHYVYFVHVADLATGRPVAQVDTMPREFAYPTGMWAPGEVVSDEVVLSLEGAPVGRYDLAVGWYDPDTDRRLSAVDEAGEPWPGDRLILPDEVVLP